MYESYWQLQRPAFRPEFRGEFYFASAGHQAACLKLRYLVEQHLGAAVLIGPAGTGKTSLIAQLRDCLPLESQPFVHSTFAQLTPCELLRDLAARLGADQVDHEPWGNRIDGLVRWIDQRLQAFTSEGQSPVLVIDDAELIEDRRVLQTLQQLLNLRRHEICDFSLIVLGQPELLGQIRRVPAFESRLAFACVLPQLTADETARYVQHRLGIAGRTQPLFTPAALAAVHRCSAGIPRRINRLCDYALLVGYADQLSLVDAAQIEAVGSELSLSAAAA
jgi:MSHA biogenesis protein MshM